jgi:predicted histone-like DNA-binding protein
MIKIKAVQRKQLVGKYEGQYRFQMSPETYSALSQSKVIKEAALRSGVSRGVMQACWDAAGEVIKAWATEGHSVALPGLGTMRFGMNAKTCETVDEVKTSLITTRKVVFTPNVELKQELKNTAVKITCYDKDGNLITTVTSTDEGNVEDNENDSNENENQNENGGGSGENGGSSNQGSGSITPGGNGDNGGSNENPGGGDDNGGGNGGSGMDQN